MPETLSLTRTEQVTVESHTPEALIVEVRYGPSGSPPPPHLHPAQDERFTVRSGELTTRVAGEERTYGPGDLIEIPRRTAHQMWNSSVAETVVQWETMPAGRTLEWFRALDRTKGSKVKVLPLLPRYRDVFRLTRG